MDGPETGEFESLHALQTPERKLSCKSLVQESVQPGARAFTKCLGVQTCAASDTCETSKAENSCAHKGLEVGFTSVISHNGDKRVRPGARAVAGSPWGECASSVG